MKMFFLALLLIINTQVFAKDWGGEQEANVDRLILDFSIDKENKFHPDIYLPFSLSDELSAAISYHTTADYEKEKIENIADSENNIEIKYSTLNIYPVLWKFEGDVLGLDIGVIDIDKQESGFGKVSGQTINFISDLTIQAIKPSLFYRFNQLKDKDNGVLYSLSVSPFSQLSVSQSTVFSGDVNASGSADGNTDSSFSMRAEVDGRHQFSSGLQTYYDFQYEYLPMEYTLDILDSNGLFTNESFDVVEHIFKASYKIKLNMNLFYGLSPVVGISYEKTNGEERNAGDSYSYERYLLVFGIER